MELLVERLLPPPLGSRAKHVIWPATRPAQFAGGRELG
jgi:hypothetical protein